MAVGAGDVVSKVAAKLLPDLTRIKFRDNLVLALEGFDPRADIVANAHSVVEDCGGVILFALFVWFEKSVVVAEVGNQCCTV